jgi:hypothetical protein
MNKTEVITGLNSLRFEAEKAKDEYAADILTEALYRLRPVAWRKG